MKAFTKTKGGTNIMKKKYTAPSVEITVLETKDIITTSGIFEDVDMMSVMGFGKIEIDIDLQ